jgi:hypothetical protein
LVGGCSFSHDALFPASGTTGGGAASGTATAKMEPPAIHDGAPTGTFVGQKVVSLRHDLQHLQQTLRGQNDNLQAIRNETMRDSEEYHGTIAAISARLQVGTTRGNPVLVQQWNTAQNQLNAIGDDVLRMSRLSNAVSSSSALAAYLLDSIHAADQLSGAVDEDHRQLQALADDTNRTTVFIQRLLSELNSDIIRQQQYIASEHQNLNTLAIAIKNGQLLDGSLAGSDGFAPATYVSQAPLPSVAAETPLVTIRFDRPNVDYQGPLYAAIKSALRRRPQASFQVVAVAPAGSSPGQQALGAVTAGSQADRVIQSLRSMGLPASRIEKGATTSATAQTSEVRIFVR